MPIDVDVRRIGFFDQPAFAGCTPRLAAAFRVDDVDYRWNRGVVLSERAERSAHREAAMRVRGLKQIVQFNWPFYAAAIGVAAIVPAAAARLPLPAPIRAIAYAGTSVVLLWIVASLAASWIVYDCSRLMEWDWVLQALGFSPKSWINLHAGLDESTPALREIFKDASGRVFDIFEAAEMTEPSIRRARLRSLRERRQDAPGAAESQHVDFRHLPVETGTIDVATLMLSAHELRSEQARSALFTELRRVLGPGGRVIVAEHLRDWANFLAFGPGAFHFHSRRTWALCFSRHRFDIHREFSITPFVRVFVLRRLT